jgi:hypothetical protein
MVNVTVTVAFALYATAMSLAFLTRVVSSAVQTLSYVGVAILGMHAVGVQVVAPVTDASAEIVANVVFAWLMLALFAVCARGVHRLVNRRTAASNGS